MAVLAANDNETLKTSAVRPGGILEMVVYPKVTHLFYIGDREVGLLAHWNSAY